MSETRVPRPTLFRPLSTFDDVPPETFDGSDDVPAMSPSNCWPTERGGPGRTGRSATPLVKDRWSVLWDAPLGGLEQPRSLLVGRGRVVVNGENERAVWTEDGRAVGRIPQTGGTALIDVVGERIIVDARGGVATYSLDAVREASFFLSFSSSGETKEILQGPGAPGPLVFVSVETPNHGTPRAEVLSMRVRDYGNIKDGILYGLEPLAGITRSDDRHIYAAASRGGPVIATRDGVLWCDWQLRPLHESLVSAPPHAISVDDEGRAHVIVTDPETQQTRYRILPPGGQPVVDLLLRSEYELSGPPIIAPSGQVYLTPPRAVLAISREGKILWEENRPSPARGSVSANGLLLVANDALDAVTADGQQRELWRPPALLVAGPILVGNRIYATSAETLYALTADSP